MTSRYYRQSIREADPLKSPISITSVEQATKIGELGVLFCVNVKNQEVNEKYGIMVPTYVLKESLHILNSRKIEFDSREYNTSDEFFALASKESRTALIFSAAAATENCEIPREIAIDQNHTITNKNSDQIPFAGFKLVTDNATQQIEFETSTITPLNESKVIAQKIIGGTDNRLKPKHYPILVAATVFDVVSLPVQILIYIAFHGARGE